MLGSGAREHAVAWKFAQSNRISGLFIAPGNAGTEEHGENLPNIDAADIDSVISLCKSRSIGLVFVGPEDPLARGMVDALAAEGVAAIGPPLQAAQLESSKAFSKNFMRRHRIPTADAVEFKDKGEFERHVTSRKGKMVIKKSGLAAGKGVLESDNKRELLSFGHKILKNDKLLVEDFLNGWEISVFAFSDGTDYIVLPYCADFKKAGEQDSGVNTGGMGAICPVPIVSEDLKNRIKNEIIVPTFDGMRDEGLLYHGILYFGLMITNQGPKLLEYNVRLGDPEAQVLLPLIRSDFVNLCEAMINGSIQSFPLNISTDSAVAVIVASEGYPAQYPTGVPVHSLPQSKKDLQLVFHAATKRDAEGRVVTGGGRCFSIVGIGPNVLTANKRAYEAVPEVTFDGAWWRHDIGQKFFIHE